MENQSAANLHPQTRIAPAMLSNIEVVCQTNIHYYYKYAVKDNGLTDDLSAAEVFSILHWFHPGLGEAVYRLIQKARH